MSAQAPALATTTALAAVFDVDPVDGSTTVSKQSGSANITLDSEGDIHIKWGQLNKEARLEFHILPEKSVEFDGVTVGLLEDALGTGKAIPISVICEVPSLPRRILKLDVHRDKWPPDVWPLYSVSFQFRAGARSWSHDPKIYSEGPETHDPDGGS